MILRRNIRVLLLAACIITAAGQGRGDVMPVISLERKPLGRYLAPYFPFYTFTQSTFRYGFTQPVPHVEPLMAIDKRIDTLAASLLFELPSKNMLRRAVMEQIEQRDSMNSGNWPSLGQVKWSVNSKKYHGMARERGWQSTASDRMDGLVRCFGRMFDVSTGFPVAALNRISWSLELPQASPEHRRCLVQLILGDLFLYRFALWQKGLPLNDLWVVIDESSEIMGKNLENTSMTQANQSTMTEWWTMGAELRCHLVCLTQYASDENMSNAALDNSAIKILFGSVGRYNVLREFAANLGCDREQLDYVATHRSPGTAYVNDMDYPYPFEIEFGPAPFKEVGVTEDVINARLAEILPSMAVTAPKPHWWRPGMPLEKPQKKPQDSDQPTAPVSGNEKDTEPSQKRQQIRVLVSETAFSLLKACAERIREVLGGKGDVRRLFGMKNLFDTIRVTSGSGKMKYSRELLDANLASQHFLYVGSRRCSFFAPTNHGWDAVGEEPPTIGKSCTLYHGVLQKVIADHFERQGHGVTIEGCLTKSHDRMPKLVDVLVRRQEAGLLAAEVELSSANSVENAKQDLLGPVRVETLLFVSPTKKILVTVERAIKGCPDLAHALKERRIEFHTAGAFFK